mmetsp:Transcript_12801/g.24973  ORF Transcript_12801/g.24973 Transcript_12801/m.24973 type:complete len:229 (+) Transcript_12801:658-1344(+)
MQGGDREFKEGASMWISRSVGHGSPNFRAGFFGPFTQSVNRFFVFFLTRSNHLPLIPFRAVGSARQSTKRRRAAREAALNPKRQRERRKGWSLSEFFLYSFRPFCLLFLLHSFIPPFIHILACFPAFFPSFASFVLSPSILSRTPLVRPSVFAPVRASFFPVFSFFPFSHPFFFPPFPRHLPFLGRTFFPLSLSACERQGVRERGFICSFHDSALPFFRLNEDSCLSL